MQDFGVDEWIMCPITGIRERNIVERDDLNFVIVENPTLVPVYADEAGENDLSTFVHPVNALYICGKAGFSPWRAAGSPPGSLRIVTPRQGGLLWAHQAMALILYDRSQKG